MEDGLSTPVGTRRSFFVNTILFLSSLIGLSLAVPFIGYVVSPAIRPKKNDWVPVAKTDELQAEVPTSLDHTMLVKDGWQEKQTTTAVWAVKKADGTVTVFSPICPHLGCGYRWDREDRLFKCPCHGSIFDIEGSVKAGPAPRPLDTLPSKIEQGELFIQYQEFKSGLPHKTEL